MFHLITWLKSRRWGKRFLLLLRCCDVVSCGSCVDYTNFKHSSDEKKKSSCLQNYLYLLTDWEGRTGKYLPRGHGVRTELEVRAPWPSAKYFPVRTDLTQSISILLYDHHAFPFFLVAGNQIRNVPLRRSFWPKSRDLYSNKVVLVRISRSLLIKSPCEGRTRS